jgi:hypothetical protein
MSERYPGGVISKTAPVPTGPYENGTAPGIWTLDQQAAFVKQGIWPLAGNVPNYIEDVFSTWLYTGTNANQTITNGIDLAGKGGLVWTKVRSTTDDHELIDTVRGRASSLESNTTDAQSTSAVGASLTQFNSNGYSLGPNGSANVNENGQTFVSWTFREQPKFFDVVTYTGNGSTNNIAHNLQSIPGCIIIKSTSTTGDWAVISRDSGGLMFYWYFSKNTNGLNSANAATGPYDSTAAINATTFNAGALQDTGGSTNQNGVTYVAYLFAHDAGGFGPNGTDNVISCGSVTTPSSGTATVNLGYEPQWVLIKRSDAGSQDWFVTDNMRGFSQTSQADLSPNTSGAESVTTTPGLLLTATGFSINAASYGGSRTFIYIAIRRGPMKVPTTGTSVFELQNLDNLTVDTLVSSAVVPDMALQVHNLGARYVVSRLTGGINTASSSSTSPRRWLITSDASAENTGTTGLYYQMQNASFRLAGNGADPGSPFNLAYFLKRAPGFFDVVCFTYANTTNERITHNLGVAPEFIIVKSRSDVSAWPCYISTSALASGGIDKYIYLNQGNSLNTNTNTWGTSNPTSTDFGMSPSLFFSAGQTLVAYLFATCAGVSKVGSYTGTGSTQTIACGFTGGARFVLIKRTDTDGYGWSVFDTARGMVSGTDPYLFLNSTAAEVNADNVYTTTGGFQLVSAAGITNASGGTYIFLAIA